MPADAPRVLRWGILWRSKNLLEGKSQHLCFSNGMPYLFHPRREARAKISEEWGYIATRRDLRREPHGWRMPIPVRVKIGVYRG